MRRRALLPFLLVAVAAAAIALLVSRDPDTSSDADRAAATSDPLASSYPWNVSEPLASSGRQFFSTWTRFRYGQAPAASIRAVDPVVRAGLEAVGPIPRSDLRQRKIRVGELRADRRTGDEITLLAEVTDDEGTYSQTATFTLTHGAWLATTVQRPE